MGENAKYYDYPEEELIERAEKTETDMKDMMRYLNEVENMMAGTDLEEIRQMLACTKKSVEHHS